MSGPADAFQKYQSLTGGTPDSATGLLSITSDQYVNLLPLVFEIGGLPYVLMHNVQIWPRFLNTVIGGNSDTIYLIVSDIGSNFGSGLDFMNGYTFLYVYIWMWCDPTTQKWVKAGPGVVEYFNIHPHQHRLLVSPDPM